MSVVSFFFFFFFCLSPAADLEAATPVEKVRWHNSGLARCCLPAFMDHYLGPKIARWVKAASAQSVCSHGLDPLKSFPTSTIGDATVEIVHYTQKVDLNTIPFLLLLLLPLTITIQFNIKLYYKVKVFRYSWLGSINNNDNSY